MSETLDQIRKLAASDNVRISEHGYDEMAEDGIGVRAVLSGIHSAVLIEDYPAFPKGRSVLVLQSDEANRPIHVVWGIPAGHERPAVLVTAYRPDPAKWSADWLRRLR
ncbi:MAG: DUF4258 domain-containing protein [Gammaproteobacteria bacterium]|nr:DUF4258 domain-containing protein [Gammaproteobacteria bacterium]